MISTRMVFGALLVTLGTLLLFDQLGRIDAGYVISRWWPVIIIALGLGAMFEGRRASLGPAVVVAVGVLLLLGQLEIVPGGVWRYVWPLLLIAAGLQLVLRRTALPAGQPDEVVNASAFFSGNEVLSTSQSFRGATLTAAFGGVTLDLRQAALAPEGATVSLVAAFGGAELIVPRGWRVQVNGTPILGGIGNKTEPPTDPQSPLLRVDATAFLGGAEIRHEK
ncbi:MAG: DUF5668 domain-containing protein [Dehalococcoidia bacterium]